MAATTRTDVRLHSLTLVLMACAVIATSSAQAQMTMVLSSGNATQDALIQNVLIAHGKTVTLGPTAQAFDGSVSLAGVQTIILQMNYNWNAGDMPALGQIKLLNYVNHGGGLLTTEWTAFQTAATPPYFTSLWSLFPFQTPGGSIYRTTASVTYSVQSPDAVLDAGLPSSFTFAPQNFQGTETGIIPRPGASPFFTTDWTGGGYAGVVGWEVGAGRVISFSTAVAGGCLTDANYATLVNNAVKWAAVPEADGFALLMGIGCLLWAIQQRSSAAVH